MDTLQCLVGKTIRSVESLDTIVIDDITYSDEVLRITFTDKTTWVLASWDYEGYSSGIHMLINEKQVQ